LRDSLISGSRPEPAINVDGLEDGVLATLALEVALPAARVNRRDVICQREKRGKDFVRPCLEAGDNPLHSKCKLIICGKRGKFTLPTLLHDFLEHLELDWVVKGDQIHASLATKVASVEPVPILEFVPGLAPGEEVVVLAQLAVGNAWGTRSVRWGYLFFVSFH